MISPVAASGGELSSASPPSEAVQTPSAATRPPAAETLQAWGREMRRFTLLMRDATPDATWLARFDVASQSQAALANSDPDTALYFLLHAVASAPDAYSARHSMLCAVAGGLCSQQLGWPDDERSALRRAALSMNVSMVSLQDALARRAQKLTATQRAQVDDHAERSAVMLASAGVTDPTWLGSVRAHHGKVEGVSEVAARLGALLERVDVYTAKLSRRAARESMSPALAARQTCLDEAGQPDPMGAVLLRAMGIYPPGCCVELSNGELGIVTRRGAKAHMPIVAVVRRADGGLFMPPVRRDTSSSAYAIAMGRTVNDLKVHLDHERALMGT